MAHKMIGEIDYPEKGIIKDEDVWRLVMNHSRPADRRDSRKMVEMALAAQTILMGMYEQDGWYADRADWQFYGEDGFFPVLYGE